MGFGNCHYDLNFLAVRLCRFFAQRRHKLCQWQQTVVKDAAAAAFSASSGRWRRMYGMEKLIANALQKITVEEVEKSQNTEDTFQKIREATVRCTCVHKSRGSSTATGPSRRVTGSRVG